jgi:hypothetical protein
MSEKPSKPYSAGNPELDAPRYTVEADAWAWAEVHKLIVDAILKGERRYFHNHSPGHPTYRLGAETGEIDLYGSDGPDRNGIYRLLQQTSEKVGDLVERRVTNWKEFCQLALEGDDQRERQ